MMDEYQEVGSTDHSCVYETRNVPLYRSWALRSLPQLNKRIPDNAALIRARCVCNLVLVHIFPDNHNVSR